MGTPGPEEQIAGSVATSHCVENGEGHRHPLVGESAHLLAHQIQPALDLPLVAGIDSPLEPADDGLGHSLQVSYAGGRFAREAPFGEGHVGELRAQHEPAHRAEDSWHLSTFRG
jgi:hypothetical protein